MTKCEYCQEHFWNEGQTSCSGGMCSSAYEMMRDEGLLDDEEEEEEQSPLEPHEFESMAGKPVYCPEMKSYGIVKYETIGRWAGIPFLVGARHRDGVAVNFEYNILERNLKCYRVEQED